MALVNPQIDENLDAHQIDKVVQELIVVLSNDLSACDMKWALFVAAAQSYRYDSQLKPFPAAYQDGASVNIQDLIAAIDKMPSLRLMYQLLLDRNERILRKYNEELKLLHWNLVTDPCLRTVGKQSVRAIYAYIYYFLLLFSNPYF